MQWPARSDASSTTLKSTDVQSLPAATPTISPVGSQTVSQDPPIQQPRNDHNPWLSRDGQLSQTAPKKGEISVSKDSTGAVKANHRLRKKQRETKNEVTKVQDDGVLEITPSNLLVASFKGSRQAEPEDYSADGDGEAEEQEEMLKRKGKRRGGTNPVFKQKELVARAFAGDNVVEVCGSILTVWYDR